MYIPYRPMCSFFYITISSVINIQHNSKFEADCILLRLTIDFWCIYRIKLRKYIEYIYMWLWGYVAIFVHLSKRQYKRKKMFLCIMIRVFIMCAMKQKIYYNIYIIRIHELVLNLMLWGCYANISWN